MFALIAAVALSASPFLHDAVACSECTPYVHLLDGSSQCKRDNWLNALCADASVPSSIACKGDLMLKNKNRIYKTLVAMNTPAPEMYAVMAIAMQETEHMDVGERDASKDGSGDAKNFSAFNMNLDMLKRVGYIDGKSPDLNDPKNLEASVSYLLRGIRHFTLNGFLAFHRGGWTSWDQFVRGGQDGYHANDIYDVQGYINCFVTLVNALAADTKLFTDNRRVEVYCAHK